MDSTKIKTFMKLAGQEVSREFSTGTLAQRKLGAQLLLSEVLEYVVHGLGLHPEVGTTKIEDPNQLHFVESATEPDRLAMLDGLSDVAYTMYWNACAFGLPLEEAFDLVCDNNLEKFVRLDDWREGARILDHSEWHCNNAVVWPPEVTRVEVIAVDGTFFAVGKDATGKVRKPSTYRPVELGHLVR